MKHVVRDSDTVLSLDWDWFVGSYNSWSGCDPCRECQHSRLRPLASRRARQRFVDHGRHNSRWNRWQHREKTISIVANLLKPKTVGRLVIAESHGRIPLPKPCTVLNLDLHADNWDNTGICANWAHKLKKYRHVVRLTDAKTWLKGKRKLSLVFLCRSSPHTSRAQDKWFYEFVRLLERACKHKAEFVGRHARVLKREYSEAVG